jgi:hypothetical protein
MLDGAECGYDHPETRSSNSPNSVGTRTDSISTSSGTLPV